MTFNKRTQSSRISSNLANGWKRFVKIVKDIRHTLGVVLVDRLMRRIVAEYDSRHGKSTKFSGNGRKEVSRLYTDSTACDLENKDLRLKLQAKDLFIDKLQTENIQIETEYKLSVSKCRELNNQLAECTDKISRMETSIDSLKNERDNLLARCLPESKIPAMVYYASGDASGKILRKTATLPATGHIYKLVTKPGNSIKGDFFPLNTDNIAETIANRNVILSACDIISIEANSNRIETIENGRAVFSENQWIVTSKAKIKLIKS